MRALLSIPLVTLLLVGPAAATAGTILSVEDPLAFWQGTFYAFGSMPPGFSCAGLICDSFEFTVELDPEMPTPYPPLVASIVWESTANDFDLFLYDAWGSLVEESHHRWTASEKLSVEEIKAGDYKLVVAPILVTNSGYAGNVGLIVE